MGRLRAMSVAKPRNSPRESKLDLQVKFIEEPDLNVERNRRSKSVSFDSFEQSNRIYEIRQRKAPVRFEPENFIRKTREAKLRRSSTPITLSPPKFEFVSVQNDIVQPKSKKLKPPAVRKADKILEETGEISRSRSKKLTHHKQIETAQFLLSSFPGSFNFARNKKGKHLSLFKYDKTGGILHMTPNTKKEIRQVENERELVSLNLVEREVR